MLLLGLACGKIPRDNVLDPKNPDSIGDQLVLVEAFVNTNNPHSYNEYMLTALDSLEAIYSGDIVIAEYHRNTIQYVDSLYHLDQSELLYQLYLEASEASLKAVPDVFVNGIRRRIQGASSVSTALFRLQEAVSLEASNVTHFTLELSAWIDGDRLKPEVTIARLGTRDIEDIYIKGVLVIDTGEQNFRHVVRNVVKSSLIPHLRHGDIETISLAELPYFPSHTNTLICYITNKDETQVLQCVSLSITKNDD
jgi:hypothetical protein